MSSAGTICVVEDDPAVRRGLVDSLRFAGFGTIECPDGPSARATLARAEVDLVLLDVVLPGLDGLEYVRELRASYPRLPVILVTARGAEEDRVRGLLGGADDYVVKPFSATELLARVEAVLRRSAERPGDVSALEVENGVVDFARCELRAATGPLALTEKELALLAYLARNRERTIARDELLRCVWGLDPRGLDTRTVDMAVARVRDKCGKDTVRTVRGQGYVLGPEAAPR
ncbi:MAG: response regulator transcription factor [Planctomycetota bacterium]